MKIKMSILSLLLAGMYSLQAQWNVVHTQTQGYLTTLHFNNADTGFVYNGNGTLLHTANGGLQWDSVSLPFTGFVEDIAFADAQTGYLSGGAWFPFGNYFGNALLKTTDGGLHWDSVYGTSNFGLFSSLAVLNADELFICGTRGFLHSADGGQTLDTVMVSNVAPGSEDYQKVIFTSADTGYVIGITGANTTPDFVTNLYRSVDGGTTWQSLYRDTIYYAERDFVFTSSGYGALVNVRGFLTVTTNNGVSWQRLALPDSSMAVMQMETFEDKLYAVIHSQNDTTIGLYSSPDWGQNWQAEMVMLSANGYIADVSMPAAGMGYFSTYSEVFKNTQLSGLTDAQALEVHVYPNPVTGRLFVEVEEYAETQCLLYDMKGQPLLQHDFYGISFNFSLEGVAAGVYVLQVQQKGSVASFKVVKE